MDGCIIILLLILVFYVASCGGMLPSISGMSNQNVSHYTAVAPNGVIIPVITTLRQLDNNTLVLSIIKGQGPEKGKLKEYLFPAGKFNMGLKSYKIYPDRGPGNEKSLYIIKGPNKTIIAGEEMNGKIRETTFKRQLFTPNPSQYQQRVE